ncbi:MAG: hypothetical protein CMO98_12650 [Woeseia sp.]|nr:hypothetical protein [Woeseia sp.]|tara:strand:- start:97 stop:1164 length:1068 start_codon:yes stop_codon:yes gene_type:complete
MTVKNLLEVFGTWKAEEKPLVVASVFETAGSTYSKTGAHMLINGDGEFSGMLSGGCLEGDLAEHAKIALSSGIPRVVTYDLGDNENELWGLGVGCDGLMHIFLLPIYVEKGYEPFKAIADGLGGDKTLVSITVIESDIDDLPIGTSMVVVDEKLTFSNVDVQFEKEISEIIGSVAVNQKSQTSDFGVGHEHARLLCSVLKPPPSILVLGGGLDAAPVVRFAAELGWKVTLQDHRPAYIEAGDFDKAEKILCVPVDNLSEAVDLNCYAGAIVMSHHLDNDRKYLHQLSQSCVGYIGLLGPLARRQRILQELGEVGRELETRLHGPAGLDIGGRGPASIALSIIAEMHKNLMCESDS